VGILDAQVHAYERDHPGRPWAATLHGPPHVSGDEMVAAMDGAGVDGALLVSPWTMYRFDPSYALEVYAAHPERFAVVAPVDPRRADVDDVFAEWAGTPGAVGVRLMLWGDALPSSGDARAGGGDAQAGLDRVASSAGRHRLPLCILGWGRLPVIDGLAARHPETQIVVDHLGLRQPFEPPPPADPFAELPAVLSLARHPNVAVKVTGAVTLSQQGYPFADIWDPLARLFDAFGVDRCLWGTDWTRATAFATYAQAVDAFRHSDRLTGAERAALMGGTLQRIFGPIGAARPRGVDPGAGAEHDRPETVR
jgi:predicted TIM-barrel fold metal-dependent hydrolase